MGDAELAARVSALETLAKRQSNLLTEQQGVIADLNAAVRNQRDPRADVLIGLLADVAQDPFSSGAWDRVRNVIRGLQPEPPAEPTSGDAPTSGGEGDW